MGSGMIVSEKYRCVYVSIPKTGTLSVRTWLRQNYDGVQIRPDRLMQEILGRRPGVGYHSYFVPKEYADYTIFTTVRNPYARCYSAYKFQGSSVSFLEWLKNASVIKNELLGMGRYPARHMMHATQTQYVQRSKATYIIKLENLGELLTLPFIDKPEMPKHLRSRTNIKPPYEKYYNKEEHQALLEYCEDDFNFGYERIY